MTGPQETIPTRATGAVSTKEWTFVHRVLDDLAAGRRVDPHDMSEAQGYLTRAGYMKTAAALGPKISAVVAPPPPAPPPAAPAPDHRAEARSEAASGKMATLSSSVVSRGAAERRKILNTAAASALIGLGWLAIFTLATRRQRRA